MTPQPHVIILNGVGSVGKTATARALQSIATQPFLHIAMDSFIDMLPQHMIDHPDGLTFETTLDHGKPSIIIRTGPVMQRALSGMRHAVAAMAAQGNNLVVDTVMLDPSEAQAYRALLSKFNLHCVGLFAPLDILEAREHARNDRAIGLARWQFDRVHQGQTYDLSLHTDQSTPQETAEKICKTFFL